MAQAKLREAAASWIAAEAQGNRRGRSSAAAARDRGGPGVAAKAAVEGDLQQALGKIADSPKYPAELRVDALADRCRPTCRGFERRTVQLLVQSLSNEKPRAAAVRRRRRNRHGTSQRASNSNACATSFDAAGPLEMNRLLKPFEQSHDRRHWGCG